MIFKRTGKRRLFNGQNAIDMMSEMGNSLEILNKVIDFEKIKNGEGDELWNDKPHKKHQKDVDAHWTKKGGDKFCGYKNHAKVDTKSKLIDGYAVTDASVHDSQPLDDLLCEDDKAQDFTLIVHILEKNKMPQLINTDL